MLSSCTPEKPIVFKDPSTPEGALHVTRNVFPRETRNASDREVSVSFLAHVSYGTFWRIAPNMLALEL